VTHKQHDQQGYPGPIVLLTDFSFVDPFVGQMKGVIAGITPWVLVIDLCHEIPPQNLIIAALFLDNSRGFFPKETIFVAVVDPGVGTQRRPILLRIDEQYFIGPDNGILFPITVGKRPLEAVQIEHPQYRLPHVSDTFHGRDIFAPAAAHLARGASMESFGRKVSALVPLLLPKPRHEADLMTGEVIHIDRFGNAWTNITLGSLEEIGWWIQKATLRIRVKNYDLVGMSESYAPTGIEKPIAVINSFELVEIAWPGGSAAEKMGIAKGTQVVIHGL